MTTGSSAAEAVVNYKHGIQRAVSCVTPSVVDVAGGYHPSPIPHRLTMNDGLPVALGGQSQFMLRLQQYYRVDETGGAGGHWRVAVLEYYYSIHDAEEKEVLLYHYHPRGNSPVETPHLHLGHGAQVERIEVRNTHLPTGTVSLNAVLRVLIEEMGVQPRRADWDSILTD